MTSPPDTIPDPAVARVVGLTKRYGSTTAVDDVSFDIRPGAITGLLGPNGAGKTTTLRLLLGLSTPTAGSATIGGRRITELEEPWRHVGAVLESGDFHPARTGRNHLRVLARFCGVGDDDVDALLDLVGLSGAAGRRVGGYSLGMRQRLGLASALLGRPGLLVLDEPANGLDPAGIRWLRDLLRSFTDDGGAVILSSHLLAEAEHSIDHVVVIHEGRLKADTSLRDLTAGGGDLEAAYLSLVGAGNREER